MWEKKGKIRRTRSMTKKRSSEIFTLKMGIFSEIGPRKNFLVPPNSAPGLRPWDRHRTNILSSSSHDIVLESHACTSRTPSLELPRTLGLDSRSEAEVDSNRTLTRTHDPGLEVAPQRYEETVHAGVSSLRGAPSDWPVRVNQAETYSYLTFTDHESCYML